MVFLGFLIIILILAAGVGYIYVSDLIPAFSLTETRKRTMDIGDATCVIETIDGRMLYMYKLGHFRSERMMDIKNIWVRPGHQIYVFRDHIDFEEYVEGSGVAKTYENTMVGTYFNYFNKSDIKATTIIVSTTGNNTMAVGFDGLCSEVDKEKGVYNLSAREYNRVQLQKTTVAKECIDDIRYKELFKEKQLQASSILNNNTDDYTKLRQVILHSGASMISFKEKDFTGEFKILPSMRRALSGVWNWVPKSFIIIDNNTKMNDLTMLV